MTPPERPRDGWLLATLERRTTSFVSVQLAFIAIGAGQLAAFGATLPALLFVITPAITAAVLASVLWSSRQQGERAARPPGKLFHAQVVVLLAALPAMVGAALLVRMLTA